MKCCDITPGMLRTTVALQSQTRTPDGAGGFSRSWSTYATVQGGLKQTSGREAEQADRLSAQAGFRCMIRYRDDVQPQHRIVIDSVAYQIRSVENVEFRNRWLVLSLESGVAT